MPQRPPQIDSAEPVEFAVDNGGTVWHSPRPLEVAATVTILRKPAADGRVELATLNTLEPDFGADGWELAGDVTLTFVRRPTAGRVEVVAPTVTFHGDAELVGRVLRRVGIPALRDQIAEKLPWASKCVTGRTWSDDVRIPRPGRRGRPLYHFADWASRYVDALEVAPDRPTALLLERYPGVTEWTLRGWLKRARSEGLLSEAAPGVAGGQLTDRCRRVLAGQEG